MNQNISQMHNCRRYISLLLPYISKFYWKSGLLSAVKEWNIIQIIVSVNIYIDMNSSAIRIHIEFFISRPLYSVSETKYKLNTYLDNKYMISTAIHIHSWMTSVLPSSIFSKSWQELSRGNGLWKTWAISQPWLRPTDRSGFISAKT